MPELPEVETVAVALAPQLRGRKVVGARVHPSERFRGGACAPGAEITDLRRRGKYLLIALGDGRELVVHLGMTGQLRLLEAPSGDPYVRAAFDLDDRRVLELRDVRRFGRVSLVARGDYRTLPGLARLGPEPLGGDFDATDFALALGREGAAVKARLLGGKVVAGVGNIYADEALWAARVHPAAQRLGRRAALALREAIIDVLRAGVEHGGTTLRDYQHLDGSQGSHQEHLRCYGRAGQHCQRCGSLLRATVVAGRTSTYCPRCQRAPRSASPASRAQASSRASSSAPARDAAVPPPSGSKSSSAVA